MYGKACQGRSKTQLKAKLKPPTRQNNQHRNLQRGAAAEGRRPPFVGAAAGGRRTYYAGATADATGVAVVFLALVLRIISTCRKHVVSFGHTFLTCRKHVVGFGHANLPKS